MRAETRARIPGDGRDVAEEIDEVLPQVVGPDVGVTGEFRTQVEQRIAIGQARQTGADVSRPVPTTMT